VGEVGFKARDLGNDRGYRVVVVAVWVRLRLNPHPHKPRVGHPAPGVEKANLEFVILRTWGAAVLRPYMCLLLLIGVAEGGGHLVAA
jgi:hypothetical protein